MITLRDVLIAVGSQAPAQLLTAATPGLESRPAPAWIEHLAQADPGQLEREAWISTHGRLVANEHGGIEGYGFRFARGQRQPDVDQVREVEAEVQAAGRRRRRHEFDRVQA